MSDLGLDMSPEREIRIQSDKSIRPRFICDIDEMSTKIRSLKIPSNLNDYDSDYVSDEEITKSITSD